MTALQQEVYEAFRAIDIPEEKALKAATTLAKRDDDVQTLKSDVSLLKWMVGFNLTLTLLGFGSVLGFLWRFVR
jgi:hypothetical protein